MTKKDNNTHTQIGKHYNGMCLILISVKNLKAKKKCLLTSITHVRSRFRCLSIDTIFHSSSCKVNEKDFIYSTVTA